jgi:hypothetical protein
MPPASFNQAYWRLPIFDEPKTIAAARMIRLIRTNGDGCFFLE